MKYILHSLFLFLLAKTSVFAADELTLIPKNDNALVTAFKTWEFSFNEINSYIVYLIDLLSVVAVVVSLIFVIIWAIKCVVAFWQEDKWTSAKKTVWNALLWLWISSLAWVIVEIAIRLISF